MSLATARPVPLPRSTAAPKGAQSGGQAAAAPPVPMPRSPARSTAISSAHEYDTLSRTPSLLTNLLHRLTAPTAEDHVCNESDLATRAA
ncbi:hypothetical protein SRHO_G00084980 [Serrasalmus rhombeus]